MATKQEILDLVGYQSINDGLDTIKVLYLTIKNYDTPSLSIGSESVECTLSEDEMITGVEALLESFPVYPADDSISLQDKELEVIETISKNALRGTGNTRFKNSLYYKGDQPVDAPVIVAEVAGKYGIFKHPNFERYGFVLE
jgi:hypothetical protein